MTKENVKIIFGEIPTSPNGAFLLNPEEVVRAWEKNINSKLPDNTLFVPSPFDIQETKPGKFIELTKIRTGFGGGIEEAKVTINTENITDVFSWPTKAENKSETHIAFISGDICRVKESYEFVSRLLLMNTSSIG